MTDVERSIDCVAKTIAGVLANQKYSIDYYQREYKWESKQVAELVADLTTKFLDLYDPAHARKDVASYPGYYLGSIIISQKGSQPFIVDGQQRLAATSDVAVLVNTYSQAARLVYAGVSGLPLGEVQRRVIDARKTGEQLIDAMRNEMGSKGQLPSDYPGN